MQRERFRHSIGTVRSPHARFGLPPLPPCPPTVGKRSIVDRKSTLGAESLSGGRGPRFVPARGSEARSTFAGSRLSCVRSPALGRPLATSSIASTRASSHLAVRIFLHRATGYRQLGCVAWSPEARSFVQPARRTRYARPSSYVDVDDSSGAPLRSAPEHSMSSRSTLLPQDMTDGPWHPQVTSVARTAASICATVLSERSRLETSREAGGRRAWCSTCGRWSDLAVRSSHRDSGPPQPAGRGDPRRRLTRASEHCGVAGSHRRQGPRDRVLERRRSRRRTESILRSPFAERHVQAPACRDPESNRWRLPSSRRRVSRGRFPWRSERVVIETDGSRRPLSLGRLANVGERSRVGGTNCSTQHGLPPRACVPDLTWWSTSRSRRSRPGAEQGFSAP